MKYILMTPCVLLVLASCHKQGDGLTPATQSGANTFSCKVNGKIWTADTKDAFLSYGIKKLSASYGVSNDTLYLSVNALRVNHAEGPDGSVYLYISGPIKQMKYPLLNEPVPYTPYPPNSTGKYIQDNLIYETDIKRTSLVTITRFDTISRPKVVSGTFEFNTKELYSDSVVRITDGRFDVQIP